MITLYRALLLTSSLILALDLTSECYTSLTISLIEICLPHSLSVWRIILPWKYLKEPESIVGREYLPVDAGTTGSRDRFLSNYFRQCVSYEAEEFFFACTENKKKKKYRTDFAQGMSTALLIEVENLWRSPLLELLAVYHRALYMLSLHQAGISHFMYHSELAVILPKVTLHCHTHPLTQRPSLHEETGCSGKQT